MEARDETYRVRKCNIYFYLEDDTMQVVEPENKNSGIPQGDTVFVCRPPHLNLSVTVLFLVQGRSSIATASPCLRLTTTSFTTSSISTSTNTWCCTLAPSL